MKAIKWNFLQWYKEKMQPDFIRAIFQSHAIKLQLVLDENTTP